MTNVRLLTATNEAFPQPRRTRAKIDLNELRELVNQGLRRQQLAAHFGCHPDRISAARKRAGLPEDTNHHGRRETINRDQVRQLTQQGHTAEQIAVQLGCSASAITKIRHELGIQNPQHRPIPPERKARIEAMLDDGCSYAEIRRTLGVTHETLQRHFPGRGWNREQQNDFIRATRTYNWGHRRAEGRAA